MKTYIFYAACSILLFLTFNSNAQVIEGERLNSEGMHAALTVKTTLNQKDTESAWQSYIRSERIGRARSPRGSDEFRVENASNTPIKSGSVLLLAKVNQVGNASELSLWVKVDDNWISKKSNEEAYTQAIQLFNAFITELRRAEIGQDIAAERKVLSDLERERSRFASRTISRTERDIKSMERNLEKKRKELAEQNKQLAEKDKKIADQKKKIENLQKSRKQ